MTQEYIGSLNALLTALEGGEGATLDVFPKVKNNDGIYTLTVSMMDKAGNTAECGRGEMPAAERRRRRCPSPFYFDKHIAVHV